MEDPLLPLTSDVAAGFYTGGKGKTQEPHR
jgi:hypothetical protein